MRASLLRAFLSHSSVDKPFVDDVFNDLGPTLAELDAATFEPAKFTHQVILNAFDRCSLFVLFASRNSLRSNWVVGEISEALKRLSDRRLKRILVFCADKSAFNMVNPGLKQHNIVRVEKTPAICARQIRGILSEMKAEAGKPNVFISRDENLADLKRLVIDPDKNFRTLVVSGFERLGRRALISRFCMDVYGSFTPPSRSIMIDTTTSPDDVYRQLLGLQHVTLDREDLLAKIKRFSSAPLAQKTDYLSSEIRAIYAQREFVQFLDDGGALDDAGDFTPFFSAIQKGNADLTDLVHIVVTFRTPPDLAP